MESKIKEQVIGICEVLYNKKAQDIKAIYVADKTIVAEWFIICSGTSVTQVKTLSEDLEAQASRLGLELRRKEGYAEGRWIVQDYADILVHIFHPEERAYYNMERLWADDPSECIEYSQERDGE